MNNDMKPTKNSPNPKQFMREVQDLIPRMEAAGVIPKNNTPRIKDLNGNEYPKISRKQAREAGYKSAREANQRVEQQHIAQKKKEFRILRLAETVEQEIKALHPLITALVYWFGWMWLYKIVGISWNAKATKEEVDGVPNISCSRLNIYRFGRVIKSVHLVWEKPGDKRKVVV